MGLALRDIERHVLETNASDAAFEIARVARCRVQESRWYDVIEIG